MSDPIVAITHLWTFAAANTRVQRYRYRRDASFNVDSYAPHTRTFCAPNSVTANSTTYQLAFADRRSSLDYFNDDYQSTFSEYILINTTASQTAWIQNALFKATGGSLLYIDDPLALNATASTLLAIAAFPNNTMGPPTLLCCSIVSSIFPNTMVGTRNRQNVVTLQNLPQSDPKSRLIYPSAAWAAKTNPYDPALGTEIFTHLAASAGLSTGYPKVAQVYAISAAESIIATMLLNGIARMPYGVTMAGQLKDLVDPTNPWRGGGWTQIMLPSSHIGSGGDAYDIDPNVAKNATKFTLSALVNGYAYSASGGTQIVSIAILLCYCVLVTGHFLYYSVGLGWTSSAWDTFPELTVLALNSDRSMTMKNTGGGIHSVHTLEENVKIMAKEERIQLIFRDTHDGATRIEPGHEYG